YRVYANASGQAAEVTRLNAGGSQTSRDLEVTDPARGVVLRAGAGGRYRLTVRDDGVFETHDAATGTGGGALDTTPPSASITAPTSGATVSGTGAMIQSSASDNLGVISVSYYLDGSLTPLATIGSSPYAYLWNTTTVANGTHALKAVARDVAGNSG